MYFVLHPIQPLELILAVSLSALVMMSAYRQSRFLTVFWNISLSMLGALLFTLTAFINYDSVGYLCAICIMLYVFCNVLISVTLFCDTTEESVKQTD